MPANRHVEVAVTKEGQAGRQAKIQQLHVQPDRFLLIVVAFDEHRFAAAQSGIAGATGAEGRRRVWIVGDRVFCDDVRMKLGAIIVREVVVAVVAGEELPVQTEGVEIE